MSVGKRKYSYLIFEDGKKERILNWFKASFDTRYNNIIACTKNGIYLYTDYDWELIPISHMYKEYCTLKRSHAFYKLRNEIHHIGNIDVSDQDVWCPISNVNRMEIMIGN